MRVKPAIEVEKHVHANVRDHAASQKFHRKQLIWQFRRVVAVCEMKFSLRQKKFMPNTSMRHSFTSIFVSIHLLLGFTLMGLTVKRVNPHLKFFFGKRKKRSYFAITR